VKPIKISLSAFGPYSRYTEIDFELLGSDGLFLITGDTGAGKTTIFDAIAFALFGEASGGKERRSSRSFRSDYATPRDETYVEFTFSHRGNIWTVRRNPEYLRDKKSGEGQTLQSANAELTNNTTGDIYTGASEVSNRIRELIGLTQDQFSQTVMIAQGDFLKILNAKSDVRKALFQKLFNTSLYADLQKKLKEMNKACEDEQKLLNQRILIEAGRIDPEKDYPGRERILEYAENAKYADLLTEQLEALIESEKDVCEAASAARKEAQERLDGMIAAIAEAKTINEALDSIARLETQLKQRTDMQPRIDADAKSLENARRAQALTSEEALLNRIKADIARLETAAKGYSDNCERLSAAIPAATDAHEKARARIPEADELLAKARQLEKCIPLLRQLTRDESAVQLQRKQLEKLMAESERAESEFLAMRSAYYLSQAGILAASLESGRPCPVCGSTEHPSPARLTEASVTQEQFEQADERRKQWDTRLRAKTSDIQTLSGSITSAHEQLSALGISGIETEDTIKQSILECTSRAEAIRRAADDAQRRLNSINLDYARAQASLSDSKAQLIALGTQRVEHIDNFRKLMAENGFDKFSDFTAAKLPQDEIQQLDRRIREHETALRSLTDQLTDKRERYSGRQRTDIQALENARAALKAQCDSAEATAKRSGARQALHEDALKNIRAARSRQKRQTEHWALVNDLYRCTAGQLTDKMKVSFETYVQQHYFRQVVAAANKRLTALTDGMFTLRCKNDTRNRMSQTGLDLDVLDRGTGMWRDVSTLSGGESFLASLALALGLSDVVQSQSGGVRIDAMFIDEGFGSLDENALKNAVEQLSRLADGKRLIGVISHVTELSERIDRKIEIRKTLTGSQATITGV